MTLSPWRLPGPQAWLERVLVDLDEGRFVVVRLPASWDDAGLATAVQDERSSLWLEIAEVAAGQPLDAVLMDLANEGTSLEAAIERLSADGMVTWLRVRSGRPAGELARLAEAHRHATERPRAVVVEHVGGPDEGPRPASPTMAVHYLYGVVGPLDTHVLLSRVAAGLSQGRRAEIVGLAGHDLNLAMRLATVGAAGLETYRVLCRERAAQLNLNDADVALPEPGQVPRREPRALEALWHRGGVDVVDGAATLHPGVAPPDELERRLWRAQVATLLPFLDEMRLALIEATRRKGLYVQPGRGDTVELVDLLRALERRLPTDPLTRAARELTRTRNDLAHLRLITEERRDRLGHVLRRAQLSTAAAL